MQPDVDRNAQERHLFTMVQLNCENLFDCRHDSLKADTDFLPDGAYRWTPSRYWQKLNRIGQTIISCGDDSTAWQLPDLVALCEVENDSVLYDLTRRSALRKARYEYLMTDSPDERGIDVALLYSPFTFRPTSHRSVRIPTIGRMRPTRDLLYVAGLLQNGDTIHVAVAHFPSRRGGERESRPYRIQAARLLCGLIDSVRAVSPHAAIIVAGDMNDYTDSESIDMICSQNMIDISAHATGKNGAKGTYRYRGLWGSLDHIIISRTLYESVEDCFINDAPWLLEEDTKYGGKQPRRNYLGPRYKNGFSDHLPLVARFRLAW